MYDFIELNISRNLELPPPLTPTGLAANIQRRKFLDVGCGEGFVLKFFKDHAWEIVGVDFSTHGIRANNPELESFIMQGDVYELLISMKEKGHKFDVIFLGNVLEHVLDPSALVDQLKNISANEMYQRIDQILLNCIGQSLQFGQLIQHIQQQDSTAYDYVIGRSQRILKPTYVLS